MPHNWLGGEPMAGFNIFRMCALHVVRVVREYTAQLFLLRHVLADGIWAVALGDT